MKYTQHALDLAKYQLSSADMGIHLHFIVFKNNTFLQNVHISSLSLLTRHSQGYLSGVYSVFWRQNIGDKWRLFTSHRNWRDLSKQFAYRLSLVDEGKALQSYITHIITHTQHRKAYAYCNSCDLLMEIVSLAIYDSISFVHMPLLYIYITHTHSYIYNINWVMIMVLIMCLLLITLRWHALGTMPNRCATIWNEMQHRPSIFAPSC